MFYMQYIKSGRLTSEIWIVKIAKTLFLRISSRIYVLRNPAKLSLNHCNINWKDRITETVLCNCCIQQLPDYAMASSILCHGLCEFSNCFFIQKSVQMLQEFNFILQQVQKAKRYMTIMRKFSSFWVLGLSYYCFSEETTAQKQTIREAFESNQIALLKKPVSQDPLSACWIKVPLGKLKSLTALKIY